MLPLRAAAGPVQLVTTSSFSVLQHRCDSTGITGTVEEAGNDDLLVVDQKIDGKGIDGAGNV